MQKLLFVILALFVFFSACNSPSSTDNPTPPPGSAAGSITGIITEMGSNSAVSGASVSTLPATTTVTTNAQGAYTISSVSPGSYTLTATADGYIEHSRSITVTSGQTTTADLKLQPNYSGSWSGTTSQDESISFTVVDNGISQLMFGYRVKVPGTKITGAINLTYSEPVSINGNTFTIGGSATISYYPTIIEMLFSFDGTFSSRTAAKGTMKFTLSGGASGDISGTWTANKT